MTVQGPIIDGELFGRKFRCWIVISGNGLVIFLIVWLAVANMLGFVETFDVIRGLLLLGYVLSWVLGSNVDVIAQREAYFDLRLPTVPRWASYLVLALTIFGGLLIVSRSDRYFATALAIFYAINVVSWCLLKNKVRSIVVSLRSTVVREHPNRIELFDSVGHYLTGNWQWCRFAAMLVAIAAAITTGFSTVAREALAVRIQESVPNWHAGTVSSHIPLICLAAFLIIAEVWVWLMRLVVYLAKRRLDHQLAIVKEERVPESANQPTGTKRRPRTKAERSPRSYSHRLQWPRYLWYGHATAFAFSVKFLVDPGKLNTSYIKICTFIFLLGLILAVLSFVSLTIVHDSSANAYASAVQLRDENSRAARKAWFDFGVSTLLLLVGLIAVTIAL